MPISLRHPIVRLRELIYYPRCASFRQLSVEASACALRPWRDQQRRYIGWRSQRRARAKNRLLVFHGNADCAADRGDIVHGFEDRGNGLWEVYLLEYPGYGARDGAPGERSFKAAAEAAVRLLRKQSTRPLFVAGESIGSGVATYIAARFPRSISGAFLITPFDTFTNVVRTHIRIRVPSFLLPDRYDNVRELARFNGRVAVLLARKDTVIPVKLGQNLYERYSGPKHLWVDPQATHNTVLKPKAKWWREVSDFLLADS